jgi:hypothetical protein
VRCAADLSSTNSAGQSYRKKIGVHKLLVRPAFRPSFESPADRWSIQSLAIRRERYNDVVVRFLDLGIVAKTRMSTPSAPECSEVLPSEPPGAARIDLARAVHQDLTSYSGPGIVFGIMLAGGAYPIVLAAIYLVAVLVFITWSLTTGYPIGGGAANVLAISLYVITGGVFCAFVGVVWATIASALTLPVVYLFLKSLKIRGSLVGLGAACGGLVGFVALLPVLLSLPWTVGFDEAGAIALILALGPGLTTILGQIGGAWGGRRAASFGGLGNAKAMEADSPELLSVMGWRAAEEIPGSTADEPRLQFGIRHMLWIFVWLSLILSAIKLCRLPFEFVLPLLVGWFVYQLMTLRIGFLLARRLVPWWARRRRCST